MDNRLVSWLEDASYTFETLDEEIQIEEALKASGQLKPSLKLIQSAQANVASAPQDVERHFQLCQAYAEDSYFYLAYHSCKNVLELDPANHKATALLGTIYESLDQKERGETLLTQALSDAPEDPAVNYFWGLHYYQNYKDDLAQNHLEKTVQHSKQYKRAFYYLAEIQSSKKSYDTALNVLKQGIQAYPDDSDLFEMQGSIYSDLSIATPERSDWFEQSRQSYEQAIKLNPTKALYDNDLGFLYWAHNKEKQAITYFQSALNKDANFVAAHVNLGKVYFADGQYDLSHEHYTKARELDPKDTKILYHLAKTYYALGETGEALKSMQEYLESNGDDANGWYGKGMIHWSKQDYRQAIWSFQKTLAIDPGYNAAKEQLAALSDELAKSGQSHLVKDVAQEFEASFTLKEVKVLEKSGMLDAAIEKLKVVLKDSPDNPQYHYALGRLYHAQRQYTLAKQHYEKAVEVGPSYGYGYIGLASMACSNGNRQEADQQLSKAVQYNASKESVSYVKQTMKQYCPG